MFAQPARFLEAVRFIWENLDPQPLSDWLECFLKNRTEVQMSTQMGVHMWRELELITMEHLFLACQAECLPGRRERRVICGYTSWSQVTSNLLKPSS